jgi:hypothetical protein
MPSINVAYKTCRCGLWLEHDIPCIDAVAYYRLIVGCDMETMMRNEVSNYYTFGYEKKLFEKNINPVTIDNLVTDGNTMPPDNNAKKQAGRPRVYR